MDEKPFMYPQENFDKYYNAVKEEILLLTRCARTLEERFSCSIALAYLEEHKSLRDYILKGGNNGRKEN